MGRADALKPSPDKSIHPPLSRAELPVDTVSLARFLIGKILVRELPEGVAADTGHQLGAARPCSRLKNRQGGSRFREAR